MHYYSNTKKHVLNGINYNKSKKLKIIRSLEKIQISKIRIWIKVLLKE